MIRTDFRLVERVEIPCLQLDLDQGLTSLGRGLLAEGSMEGWEGVLSDGIFGDTTASGFTNGVEVQNRWVRKFVYKCRIRFRFVNDGTLPI